MAADNWAICPKCEKDRFFEPRKNTLREDYEIGVTVDGEFFVVYRGNCKECGFKFEFDHAQYAKID